MWQFCPKSCDGRSPCILLTPFAGENSCFLHVALCRQKEEIKDAGLLKKRSVSIPRVCLMLPPRFLQSGSCFSSCGCFRLFQVFLFMFLAFSSIFVRSQLPGSFRPLFFAWGSIYGQTFSRKPISRSLPAPEPVQSSNCKIKNAKNWQFSSVRENSFRFSEKSDPQCYYWEPLEVAEKDEMTFAAAEECKSAHFAKLVGKIWKCEILHQLQSRYPLIDEAGIASQTFELVPSMRK